MRRLWSCADQDSLAFSLTHPKSSASAFDRRRLKLDGLATDRPMSATRTGARTEMRFSCMPACCGYASTTSLTSPVLSSRKLTCQLMRTTPRKWDPSAATFARSVSRKSKSATRGKSVMLELANWFKRRISSVVIGGSTGSCLRLCLF